MRRLLFLLFLLPLFINAQDMSDCPTSILNGAKDCSGCVLDPALFKYICDDTPPPPPEEVDHPELDGFSQTIDLVATHQISDVDLAITAGGYNPYDCPESFGGHPIYPLAMIVTKGRNSPAIEFVSQVKSQRVVDYYGEVWSIKWVLLDSQEVNENKTSVFQFRNVIAPVPLEFQITQGKIIDDCFSMEINTVRSITDLGSVELLDIGITPVDVPPLSSYDGKYRVEGEPAQYMIKNGKVISRGTPGLGGLSTENPNAVNLIHQNPVYYYNWGGSDDIIVNDDGTISVYHQGLTKMLVSDNRPNTNDYFNYFPESGIKEDEVYGSVDPLDPASYIRAFIADGERHGIDMSALDEAVDTFKITITHDVPGGATAYAPGDCYQNTENIFYHHDWWYAAPQTDVWDQRLVTVFHELAHSVLLLHHTRTGDGLMSSTVETYDCNAENMQSFVGIPVTQLIRWNHTDDRYNLESVMDRFWSGACAPTFYETGRCPTLRYEETIIHQIKNQ